MKSLSMILRTNPYLPNEPDETETKTLPPARPPLVTPHGALAYIERLLLFPLQSSPTANMEVLNREKKTD